jgi:hypothetical protein
MTQEHLSRAGGPPSAESLVFETGVAEKLKAYVYLLTDPRTNLVFYVGKGNGGRAYSHALAALGPEEEAAESNLKLATIRAIHAAGQTARLEILRHGMTDPQALLVEAAAIDLLAHHGQVAQGETEATLSNLQRGHDSKFGFASVGELAVQYGAKPVGIEDHLILIRPRNLWRDDEDDEAKYEATRKWWRLDAARRTRYPHAAAVVDGILRMVWRIERWEEDPTEHRSAFIGSRDPEFEARYVWGDVSKYLPVGARNPIRYVDPSDTIPCGTEVDVGDPDQE